MLKKNISIFWVSENASLLIIFIFICHSFFQLALLDSAASNYVERSIGGMDNIPTLFPHVLLNVDQLSSNLK